MAGFRKHYVLHESQGRQLWDTLKCEAWMSQVWNTSYMAWDGLMLIKLQLHKTRPSSKANRSSASKDIQ
jgi:hypothetical protein